MSIEFYNPKVELIASLEGGDMTPEDLVVFGAHATTKKEDLRELYIKALKEDRLEAYRKRILRTTLESGHLSVLDQAVFSFSIRDIPRLSTLFLVQPLYLSHLQQSMRVVEPYGLYIPDSLKKISKVVNDMLKSIELYYKMVNNGIPKEDARYVIPLYTVTNILTVGNARELTYLYLLARDDKWIPNITRHIVNMIIEEAKKRAPDLFEEWGENYNILRYYPAPNLFRKPDDKIDSFIDNLRAKERRTIMYSHVAGYKMKEEDIIRVFKYREYSILTLLRNNSYNLLTRMSLAALHQALRQRTWNHVTESLFHALKRIEYVIPPSIKNSEFKNDYINMVNTLYKDYKNLANQGLPKSEIVGVISHAHMINDLMKIDGWNVVSALPIRRCLKAQWEIRFIAGEIASEIKRVDPVTARYSLPPCITIGKCPERNPCKYVDHFLSIGPYIKSSH